MSTTDLKPFRKQKQKESKQPAPNGAERLKSVVRRLPPNLPEEIFWQSVQRTRPSPGSRIILGSYVRNGALP